MREHRAPGFTEQEQEQGKRAKRKPDKAVRHQLRRQRQDRRRFESFQTTDAAEVYGS